MPEAGARAHVTRLFVAAWPNPETIECLVALTRSDETGIRRVPEENLHITLRFLGDADPAMVIELLAAASFPAATAVLGPTVERLGRRQFVVPVTGVDTLATVVRSATSGIGEHDRRPFLGHVTVARNRPDATSALAGSPIAADFVINDVALVASDLQSTGVVYTTIASFPVNGSPPRAG